MRNLPDRLFLILFAAVLPVLFWRGLWIEPAGDDWLLLTPIREMVRESGLAGAALRAFAYPIIDQFYRPLALLPQLLITDSVLLPQLLKLLVQLGFFLLLRRTARELGIPAPWSSLTAAIPLLHQVFTSVLTEIDLWGDQLSAVAFVALFWVALRYDSGKAGRFFYVIGAALITIGCLLAKEAGVAAFITPLGFGLVAYFRRTQSVAAGHFAAACATLCVAVLYLLLRLSLGVDSSGSPAGYYALDTGINMLTNVGLGLLALFSPMNTVEVALGSTSWRLSAVLWTLGGMVVVAVGLAKSIRTKTWQMPLLLFVFALAAQGPVMLMPHLTEANFTRSLALGWLGMALLIKAIIGTECRRRSITLLLSVAVVWFALDIHAINSKTRDIEISQAQASRFRRTLLALAPTPEGIAMHFAIEDPADPGYSVYRQPFLVDAREGELAYGLRDLYKKSDLRVEWFETPVTNRPDTLPANFYVRRNGQVIRAGN